MLRGHDTAVLVTPIAPALPEWSDVDWIGVDAGCLLITKAGKICHHAIGDFDSGRPDHSDYPLEIHPIAKNETDTELALQEAASMGYREIIVWGGLGGRLDHTLANLRVLAWQVPQAVLMDDRQRVSVLLPGDHVIQNEYPHISFFALEESVITLEGFDYPLCDEPIDQKDLFTTSNSISGPSAIVRLKKGRVLCVESKFR